MREERAKTRLEFGKEERERERERE